MKQTSLPLTIDDYIATFPAPIQKWLSNIRNEIKKENPYK
jgi:hypothetical protein